jgi:hypothetical protein
LKAEELKNKGIKIKLADKEYVLKFDMNTFCELEEVYGDINKAFAVVKCQPLEFYKFITDNKRYHDIKLMCKVLNVYRSSYYKYINCFWQVKILAFRKLVYPAPFFHYYFHGRVS